MLVRRHGEATGPERRREAKVAGTCPESGTDHRSGRSSRHRANSSRYRARQIYGLHQTRQRVKTTSNMNSGLKFAVSLLTREVDTDTYKYLLLVVKTRRLTKFTLGDRATGAMSLPTYQLVNHVCCMVDQPCSSSILKPEYAPRTSCLVSSPLQT